MLFFVYYVRDLIVNFKIYLKHCFDCQTNQIRKHKFHEFFQSIQSSSVSFHIIVMNFILTFFSTKKKLNCVMSVTCKFFKRIILISKNMIWKAKNWIKVFLIRFDIMNWKLFKQIINDRDRKFLSEFWIAFFINFEIRFFYNTAYHFQIDEQFERINQSVEIAFRYHLVILKKSIMWTEILAVIQKIFNNFVSTRKKIFNEIVYEFIFTESADLMKSISESVISVEWIRQKITDAIAFSQLISKHYYDQKHKSIQFSKKSWALFRLHQKYSIFFIKKLEKFFFEQFVKFFKILQRIKNFVYRLEISNHWRIHFVFIIVQLKSVSDSNLDFYNRQRIKFFSVHVKKDIDAVKNYVIEKIIKIRISIRDKEYFIRWKKYGSENDAWKNLSKMNNALNLVRKYEKQHSNHLSANSKNQFTKKRNRSKKNS